jgi:N-acetylmuramoyl-L-alanine amidase
MADPIGTPLGRGSSGPFVSDLQRRLARAGFDTAGAGEVFDEAIEDALARFQRARGLESTGRCDDVTWEALVEASWRLGDRHLYLHAPFMRGDDVAALQLGLGRLGFDAGRVDGIFGPDTQRALTEFQRNAGLVTDGIVGPDTVDALHRIGSFAGREPVASVRERDRLRAASGPLGGRRIMIGDLGGASALTALVSRTLREHGADAMSIEPQDPSAQARRANDAFAAVYIGIHVSPTTELLVAHFATEGFESQGGRRLADALAGTLGSLGLSGAHRAGLRLPVLRETRMPAVYLRLGPASVVVRHAPRLADALSEAVSAWALSPVDDEPTGSSPDCG